MQKMIMEDGIEFEAVSSRCTTCGEQYIDEEDMHHALNAFEVALKLRESLTGLVCTTSLSH